MVTNGILLTKQPDSFWESCKKNEAEIVITRYPIKLDFDKIERIAKEHGVNLSYYSGTDKITKHMYIKPLDITGSQDIKKTFRLCFDANECISLHEGKLYTCVRCYAAVHFNNYFKTNLEETDADSIDIYKAKTIDEILDFLRRPIPFCKYCNWKQAVFYAPWHTSKKEISEWAVAP
jgi:hypothetical protein